MLASSRCCSSSSSVSHLCQSEAQKGKRDRTRCGLELFGPPRSPSHLHTVQKRKIVEDDRETKIEIFLLVIAGWIESLGEGDHLRIDGDPRENYPNERNESFCLRSPQRRRIFHHGSRYATRLWRQRAQRHAIFWVRLKNYSTDTHKCA